MIPKIINRIPNKNAIMLVVDAHPGTVCPWKNFKKIYKISRNANKLVAIPTHTPKIKGFVEKETMAPLANFNIVLRLYLVSPATRSPT